MVDLLSSDGQTIAKDQRSSQSYSESIGLCKNLSMERGVGKVTVEAPRQNRIVNHDVSTT